MPIDSFKAPETSNVVSLRGGKIPKPVPVQEPERGTPQPDVIRALEIALDLARVGEIAGFVAAWTYHDKEASSERQGGVGTATLALLEMARHNLAALLINNGTH